MIIECFPKVKPAVAMQWEGPACINELEEMTGYHVIETVPGTFSNDEFPQPYTACLIHYDKDKFDLYINTQQGICFCGIGDWIVKKYNGDVIVVRKQDFKNFYN